ncbi:MAG: DNA/RNA non-specific endonuclease [Planctomycetes bacterium]|nr:DNA/RNA non-specific endonuclease [Planctomycetota bacterium]
MRRLTLVAAVAAVLGCLPFVPEAVPAPAPLADFKEDGKADGYAHDRWKTLPCDPKKDYVREFKAFLTCFDSDDDDDGDGTPDKLGIPHWVAYEMRSFPGKLPKGPARPPEWITVQELFEKGITPADASYHFPDSWRNAHPGDPQLGYDRGHMCMKQHAWRLGKEADWNTHTLLNACPQKGDLNQGIWQDLENRTAAWADRYGAVWIVCGPVLLRGVPARWLGQEGEVPVRIPDAFFKIVVLEPDDEEETPRVLAFLYPQEGIGYKAGGGYDHAPYLTSVDVIEALTGLDFLTALEDGAEEQVERVTQVRLWE